jgi:hypothetical protein
MSGEKQDFPRDLQATGRLCLKGTIIKCIQDLVTKKFGPKKWTESLKFAGVSTSKRHSTSEDVDDAEFVAILKGAAHATSLSLNQVMEAFGEHWCAVYAPAVHKKYFAEIKSTRELLVRLDGIHLAVTRSMEHARPPRFRYEWQGDNYLILHYQSNRGLVALMPGLIAGLGKFYKDTPTVRVAGNAVHVQFN